MERLAQIAKEAGAHSARLVYTEAAGHPAWEPWQVIIRWQDGREYFCRICSTADEAIAAAVRKAGSLR